MIGGIARRWLMGCGVIALAGPALADPCTAPVTGYRPGATVAGEVRYVGDGDGLCVGTGPYPRSSVDIRLADFYASELYEAGGEAAKRTLQRLTIGKRLVCTAQRGARGRTYTYDRLIASCTINGAEVGDLMRRAGVGEGGRGR